MPWQDGQYYRGYQMSLMGTFQGVKWCSSKSKDKCINKVQTWGRVRVVIYYVCQMHNLSSISGAYLPLGPARGRCLSARIKVCQVSPLCHSRPTHHFLFTQPSRHPAALRAGPRTALVCSVLLTRQENQSLWRDNVLMVGFFLGLYEITNCI